MERKELICIGCPLGCNLTVEMDGAQVVSVKTATDIPKNKIRECLLALKGVTLTAPVQIGDVIVENVADTGVDIVATKNVE